MANMNYIICSGWWCDGSGTHGGRPLGSPETRKVKFFKFWLKQIHKYSNPVKIFITDSASPITPNQKNDFLEYRENDKFNCVLMPIEWVSLIKNFGHAADMDINDKLCGFTRSILLGIFYCLMNNIQYFVYIEQDCIIHGENIIETAIKNMKGYDYSHGIQYQRMHKCETSFIILRQKIFMPFIQHMLSYEESDKEYIPERKFKDLKKKFKYIALPFGYGRDRPINFENEHFYFQHATDEELKNIGYEMG